MNALLEGLEKQESFLEAPASNQVDMLSELVVEEAGTLVGPYKLLQQIGKGGFGIVYEAEQIEPVRRKVALKLIKPGMDTEQIIARFEAERQALALMDHPHIAQVFDAGATASGRPYFVMELVHGAAITQFCDQQKLSLRARLELFVDVCRAVQHAHQKGIIHRDLKPANIVVSLHGERPIAKVIDFGIAKAFGEQLTDKTFFTAQGQFVGTPAYMSPEQMEMGSLDLDTRSDIYSLGVLLYELLTGVTPFDETTLKNAGFDEMRRMIREDEPAKPSSHVSALPEDELSARSQQRNTDPRRLHGERIATRGIGVHRIISRTANVSVVRGHSRFPGGRTITTMAGISLKARDISGGLRGQGGFHPAKGCVPARPALGRSTSDRPCRRLPTVPCLA